MIINILTLFPLMFNGPLTESLLGKAISKNLISINIINFRDYSRDKHKRVDDTIYGGGVGMLLRPEPIIDALHDNVHFDLNHEIILLSPQGKSFTQYEAKKLAKKDELTFICGHYEGFDERVRHYITAEYSIGDYVLTGGEIPSMVMIDSICRLIPGVIKESSYKSDSFYNGLLEYPQYTKPRTYDGLDVPEVLLSGHHEKIMNWQLKESLRRTLLRRPDLLAERILSEKEKELLNKIKEEESV